MSLGLNIPSQDQSKSTLRGLYALCLWIRETNICVVCVRIQRAERGQRTEREWHEKNREREDEVTCYMPFFVENIRARIMNTPNPSDLYIRRHILGLTPLKMVASCVQGSASVLSDPSALADWHMMMERWNPRPKWEGEGYSSEFYGGLHVTSSSSHS